MYLNQKNKNPRSVQLLGDIVHILICICIVALAVLAFLDPAENSMVYPGTGHKPYCFHIPYGKKDPALCGRGMRPYGI